MKIEPEKLTLGEQIELENGHNTIRFGFAHADLIEGIGLKKGKHMPRMVSMYSTKEYIQPPYLFCRIHLM